MYSADICRVQGWYSQCLSFLRQLMTGLWDGLDDRGSISGRGREGILVVPPAVSPGIKRPGSETDHSTPSAAEAKNAWINTYTPTYVFIL
jgi:hypothetical protein